jgi:hypothetical protein
MTRFFAGAVLVASVLCVGCRRPGLSCDAGEFGPVFKGFVYVGSFSAQPPGHGVPSHGYNPVPLPDSFVPGRLYVFHHVGPLDSSQFGIRELPPRLEAAGMTILHAPRSEADLLHGEPTGLYWWVDFQAGQCQGRIRNSLDTVLYYRGGLSPGGSMEAFVLTVQGEQ